MNVRYPFCFFALFFISSWGLYAVPVPVDGYAASVNGTMITVGDVMSAIQPMATDIQRKYKGRDLELKLREAFKRGLERLVDRELILASFQESERQLPSRAVDDRVNEMIYAKFDGNRATFLEALKAEGMTLPRWKKRVREDLIISISRQESIIQRAVISAQDVRAFYEAQSKGFTQAAKSRLHMLAVKSGFSAKERADQLKLIFRLRYQIMSGDDFEELAREHSTGAYADKGGDMGWVEVQSLRSELRGAVEHLEPMELSDIIEGEGELFLLRLDERSNEKRTLLESVEEDLRSQLLLAEQERLYKQWMARLKKQYPVKRY